MEKKHPQAEIMLEVRLHGVETDEESRQAYETVYSTADISQSDAFYRWMMGLLDLRPGEKYLDISCGRGELIGLAQEKGVQAHGMDLSHNALLHSRAETGNRWLVTANSQELPYQTGRFDIVSNVGSLEHYVDMPAAVREMARVLRPSGRAVVLVPNTFSLLNNIWIAWRQGRTSIDPYQPIQRYGARLEWQQLLESNGLAVEKTVKYDRVWPRSGDEWRQLLRHPKELARVLVAPLVPLNLAFCFVFLCRKAAPT